MTPSVSGIHHITAMAGDPQVNLDFYTRTLGLRLVKRTVNFDDPTTYHFYYGDETGTPGSLLTFFPWGGDAPRGRIGTAQVALTSFAVNPGALTFWTERLSAAGLTTGAGSTPFGEPAVSLRDPDGLGLQLVEAPDDGRTGWATADIPETVAIRGFHAAALSLVATERTARLLTEVMGLRVLREEGDRVRLVADNANPGTIVDLALEPTRARGLLGTGVVHHIAFRAATADVQLALRDRVEAHGLPVTPVLDRSYFRSIYYREPGGVLFEVATDAPGFTIDEPAQELGMHLKLPAWLESHRGEIESQVDPIIVPDSNRRA